MVVNTNCGSCCAPLEIISEILYLPGFYYVHSLICAFVIRTCYAVMIRRGTRDSYIMAGMQ